jgi:ferredoxin-type protein NapH
MAQAKRRSRRQAVRRGVLLISLLLFPVVLNYISPYVIIDGAMQGIINGSFIVFGLLFLSSLFVGRLWCAWLCPAAGLGEACFAVNDRPAHGGKLNWIKWAIWIPWIGLIAYAAISAGGYTAVNFLHLTDTGISTDEPIKYVTYYLVVGMLFLLSVILGRRAFCHYGCWMAPFMIIGRKIRNASNTPALRLRAEPEKCIHCDKCTQACPMSLDVQTMVESGTMENSECILCGSCVDTCPKQVIHYSFSRSK